jgi:hypothetical protein
MQRIMTGFPVLDSALGLTFVYLLLALISTTLMEWIAQIGKFRGNVPDVEFPSTPYQYKLNQCPSIQSRCTKP